MDRWPKYASDGDTVDDINTGVAEVNIVAADDRGLVSAELSDITLVCGFNGSNGEIGRIKSRDALNGCAAIA